jgi:outer membrane usher protein
MSQRRSSRRSDAKRAAFLCVLLLLAGRITPSRAASRDLLLAVELNGRPLDTLVEARQTDGELFLQNDDLPAIGLRPPKGPAGKQAVALGHLRGIAYRIDEPRQMLLIQADQQALLPQILGRHPITARPQPSDPGLLLTYDLSAIAGRSLDLAGTVDARANLPFGYLSNGLLLQSQFPQPVVRLSTDFTYQDWDHQLTWQAGDVLSGDLSWTRQFRLGGIQLQSSFDMRPDLVTTPVPVLSGRAAVPSTVELLVNGVRQYSDQVQAGPFIIREPPILTGAGNVTLVTSNALGQQSVQTVPLYVSPDLLAQGLASYSMEAGLLRTGYGTPYDRYEQAAGSATLRYGLTDRLTGEAHLEASGPVQMAGIGAAINLANQAVLTAALAASRSTLPSAGSGEQFSVGLDHVDPVFNFSASLTARSRGFRDVPAATGDPVPVRILRCAAGINAGGWGTLRAAYVATTGGLLPSYTDAPLPSLAVGTARIGSVTYTRPLGRPASLYVTAYRDFAQHDSAGLLAGISLALGPRRSADLSGALAGGKWTAALDADQSATEPGEFGGRIHLGSTGAAEQTAEAVYYSQYARATAGIERIGAQTDGRADLQGSLVLADGGLFAANQVSDSYAIVDTQGQAGLKVLLENRAVGVTNAAGRLLVPDLRGWDTNHISIDPTALPAEMLVEDVARIVRPAGHGAVSVRFRITGGDSALIRLTDPAGQPIQAGASATLQRTGKHFAIGYDGEVFATGLHGSEHLLVATDAGLCIAAFTFHPVHGDIPTIAPVVCSPRAAP